MIQRRYAEEATSSLFVIFRRALKLRGKVYNIGDFIERDDLPRHKHAYDLIRQKKLRPATAEEYEEYLNNKKIKIGRSTVTESKVKSSPKVVEVQTVRPISQRKLVRG